MSHAHSLDPPGCKEISLSITSDLARIDLIGEIDIEVRPCFKRIQEELRNYDGPIVVEAQEVSFIDSSGIAILGEIAHEHPGNVTLEHVPPTMLFILEITTLISDVKVAS